MCEARRCCLSIFSVCLAIIVYIVVGALAFFFLESHYQKNHGDIIAVESVSHQELDTIRNATVQRLWTLTMELNVFYESNWTQLAELELQKFQEDVLRHLYLLEGSDYHRRETYIYNDDSFENFPAALLYALTLITTIGYGSVSPKSLAGRILTVFYAAIGIPLTLCYLATVGDFLSRCIRTIYYKIRCGKQRKGGCGVPIPVSLVLVFCYLCGGAGVFWWLEGWPFVDAIFFCFASLATIGFGGMLDPRFCKHVSLLVSSVYILLGMALISTVFNFQEEIVRGKSGRGRHYHRPIS
ncbi:potassium channel subfamily K member 9 isoform X2 [Folsomia candida]|uniref:potassium channel subfamily K member 9 isoform X2 n=1 Tax=Folsomia candida TaxID=158441 RepID=UPI00160508E4|nr:potassium channel subfamily K member 9 isoform X2 [Folsomia candida]